MAESLNGGTAAPRRDRHAAVQKRIGERRRTQRGSGSGGVAAPATAAGPTRPASTNGATTAPDIGAVAAVAARRIARGGGGGGGGNGGGPKGPAIGRAEQPGLGAQLTRRVQSGAIDQAQAQQTVQDRALLEQAFGPDWRNKVFGGTGVVQKARIGLKANPTDPRQKALVEQLKKKRSGALERARAKVEATAPGTI